MSAISQNKDVKILSNTKSFNISKETSRISRAWNLTDFEFSHHRIHKAYENNNESENNAQKRAII